MIAMNVIWKNKVNSSVHYVGIGRCNFACVGDQPNRCSTIGSMAVHHNGDFQQKSTLGKYDFYGGTGTIWVIFHSRKSAQTFRFIVSGSVQTCTEYWIFD